MAPQLVKSPDDDPRYDNSQGEAVYGCQKVLIDGFLPKCGEEDLFVDPIKEVCSDGIAGEKNDGFIPDVALKLTIQELMIKQVDRSEVAKEKKEEPETTYQLFPHIEDLYPNSCHQRDSDEEDKTRDTKQEDSDLEASV